MMESIKISGLQVFAYHGVFEAEKELGQKFILDMEIFLDMSKVFYTKDLQYSVHYGLLAEFASKFFKENRRDLIENAADDLASAILNEFPLINEINITVSKPWAPVHLPTENIEVRVHKKWETIFLGIGTNLGNKEQNLNKAIEKIRESNKIRNLIKSSFIETKAWGVEDQPDFLNGALKLETIMKPHELLLFVKGIEEELGREETYRWGPRLIDIDILFYGNELVTTDELIIPHPQISNREFVLKPLMELDPDFIHPYENKSISQIYKNI